MEGDGESGEGTTVCQAPPARSIQEPTVAAKTPGHRGAKPGSGSHTARE